MVGQLRAVLPPATVPKALEERSRMAVDEMQVAPQCCMKQIQMLISRMFLWHRIEDSGEVADEIEDHELKCLLPT